MKVTGLPSFILCIFCILFQLLFVSCGGEGFVVYSDPAWKLIIEERYEREASAFTTFVRRYSPDCLIPSFPFPLETANPGELVIEGKKNVLLSPLLSASKYTIAENFRGTIVSFINFEKNAGNIQDYDPEGGYIYRERDEALLQAGKFTVSLMDVDSGMKGLILLNSESISPAEKDMLLTALKEEEILPLFEIRSLSGAGGKSALQSILANLQEEQRVIISLLGSLNPYALELLEGKGRLIITEGRPFNQRGDVLGAVWYDPMDVFSIVETWLKGERTDRVLVWKGQFLEFTKP